MKDCYEEIHRLLHSESYSTVLSMLCSKNGREINSPYDNDLNHGWYIVGDIYYKNENYELAVSAFKKAIQHREDDSEAYFALSNSYSELGMPDKAEHSLRKAITFKRKNVYVYNLANSLFDQGKYLEAIKLYGDVSGDDDELYSMAQKNLHLAKRKI